LQSRAESDNIAFDGCLSVAVDFDSPFNDPLGSWDDSVAADQIVGVSALASAEDAVARLWNVNVSVYNGQGAAAPVNARLERTVGAFTVANLNNTDGDFLPDKDDPFVFNVGIDSIMGLPITWPGTPEVDLMKIELNKPNDPNPGNNQVTLTVTGPDVKVWESPYKITEVALTNGSATFAVNALPKTFWVEARAASNALRDIEIKMTYRGASNRAKATGIWAEKTNFRNGGTTLSPNVDDKTMRRIHAQYNRPFGTPLDKGTNGMEMEFTVKPSGIGLQPGIVFDISRNNEGRKWDTIAGVRAEDLGLQRSFPAWLDIATDDGLDLDEDSDPRVYFIPGYPVINTNKIYVLDYVGKPLNPKPSILTAANGDTISMNSCASTSMAANSWR